MGDKDTVKFKWCNSCKMFHLTCPDCNKTISFKRKDLEELLKHKFEGGQ